MPLPTPSKSILYKEWMEQCLLDEVVQEEFGKGTKQAKGYCYSAWIDRKRKRSAVFGCELRASYDGKTIIGRIPYYSESRDLGGFREILKPGCFSESLATRDMPVLSFWNHNKDQVLGSTENHTLKIEDTADSLRFKIRPPDTSYSRDALELIRSGTITGASFGFTCQDEKWNKNLRSIIKAELFEISPCSQPAYAGTTVSVRRKTIMETPLQAAREARKKAHLVMCELNEQYDKRAMPADKLEQYKNAERDFEQLSEEIEALERRDAESKRRILMEMEGDRKDDLDAIHRSLEYVPARCNSQEKRDRKPASYEERRREAAWEKYVQPGGEKLLTPEERITLMADADVAMGYAVPPATFQGDILRKVEDEVILFRFGTKYNLDTGASLQFPAEETDPEDGSWGGEVKTAPEDTAMSVQARAWHPHPVTRRIMCSNTLLRQASMNVASYLTDKLGYKLSITIEQAGMTEDGSARPLGIFTASNSGISTSRDLSTDNTVSSVKADNLIRAKFMLKSGYLRRAVWIMHRDTMRQIYVLKSGEGMFLFQPSLQKGTPDQLLGLPVYLSEYAPNTISSQEYCYWLGDPNHYIWVMSQNINVKALEELYYESNRTAFVARAEIDGNVDHEECCVRGQFA